MHKSLSKIGLATTAMALAMTPALAAAQDQAAPSSMPETPATTGTPPTGTPPTATPPADTPPVHTPGMPHSDTTTESAPDQTTMPAPDSEQATGSTTTDPVGSQTATPPLSSAERDAKMQAWPEEQRTAFNAWTPETQTYFWTLSEDRQKIFWRIADADKATLATMAEPQREATWVELENRIKTMQG